MKSLAPPPKPASFNITPLIDVVFLLIVFFVMSSRLIREETAMELDLPRERSGVEQREEDQETDRVVINVTESGEYYFGAKRVTRAELKACLARARSRATRPTSALIRASRKTPYSVIEPALVLCAQTGFANVSFAVVDP